MPIAKLFRDLKTDQFGATAVEYGLVAGLVAVTILSALQVIGGGIAATLNTISNAIMSSL